MLELSLWAQTPVDLAGNSGWAGAGLLGLVLLWLLLKHLPDKDKCERETRAEFMSALREQRTEFLIALKEERSEFRRLVEVIPQCRYLECGNFSPRKESHTG